MDVAVGTADKKLPRKLGNLAKIKLCFASNGGCGRAQLISNATEFPRELTGANQVIRLKSRPKKDANARRQNRGKWSRNNCEKRRNANGQAAGQVPNRFDTIAAVFTGFVRIRL